MHRSTLTLNQAMQLAFSHHQAGRLPDAETIYRQVLAAAPAQPDALYLLGLITLQKGFFAEALQLAQRACTANPANPMPHFLAAEAYRAQNCFDPAIEHLLQALHLKPDFIEAHINLGNLYLSQHRLIEATDCFRAILTTHPHLPEIHAQLGDALESLGQPEEAILSYRQALALRPDSADIHNNLGSLLKTIGQLDEALQHCRQAVTLRPDVNLFYYNLGNICWETGYLSEAANAYRKAIALGFQNPDILASLAGVLQECGEYAEAIAHYQKALSGDPDLTTARLSLTHLLQHTCQWDDLDKHIPLIRQSLHRACEPRVLLSPFSFLALPGTSASEQKTCAERWAASRYPRLPSPAKSRRNGEKIHIGYLSSDFHDHATAHLLAEVFELHDHERFEISAFSYGPDQNDAMRQRLRQAFTHFIDLRTDSYPVAAQKIQAAQVDILVDLKGYTENSRSDILALRPAPIQVNFLGYPGTMGAPFIDYLIADEFVIPPQNQTDYSEKIIYLPNCYQPNDRRRPHPPAPSRAECGIPEDAVVFCCFNHTYKITPKIFDVWCRLLQEIPGSILWLLASNSLAETNLKSAARQRGIAEERLILAPKLPQAAHLARLQCADLFLDTLPVNAHTTCSDALWMGVPVVTCCGATFASRVAGSLLNAIGLPQLITENLADYYELARQLSLDPALRRELQIKLVQKRNKTPLFNSEQITKNLEELFWQISRTEAKTIP